MNMKRMFWVLLVLFLLTLLPPGVQAHSPKKVDVEYNYETQTLTLTLEHWAVTPSIHFIETVTIRKNGKIFEKIEYKDQPATEEFGYSYKVPAEAGDVLEVAVTCSVHGGGKASLKVKKPKEKK